MQQVKPYVIHIGNSKFQKLLSPIYCVNHKKVKSLKQNYTIIKIAISEITREINLIPKIQIQNTRAVFLKTIKFYNNSNIEVL